MLDQPTIEKLQAMQLHGMAEVFQGQIEIPESSELSWKNDSALEWIANGPGRKLAPSHDGCNWLGSRNAASWKTLAINIHAA